MTEKCYCSDHRRRIVRICSANYLMDLAHHTSIQRSDSYTLPTINTILPVVDQVSNDVDFKFHVTKLVMEYMNYINPGQTTVGCSDQPLYALKTKIQWSCPQIFPIKSYFPFFGSLHIEQALLKIHGQLVKGSGIDNIIGMAGLPTAGLRTTVCDANSIKKS